MEAQADDINGDLAGAAERLRRQQGLIVRLGQLAVAGRGRLAEIVGLACRFAADGTGVSRSKLMVHDQERGDLVVEAACGWGPEVLLEHVRADLRSPAGPCLWRGESVVVRDLRSDPRFDAVPPLDRYGIVSLVNVPIAFLNENLGVLEIDSDVPCDLGEDDVRFLEGLASIVAGSLLRFEREDRYRSLFASIDSGFCILELKLNGGSLPADFRFLEINPAFERQTGSSAVAGRWIRESRIPYDDRWLDRYGRVAMTGDPERFEDQAPNGRWYSVYAFPVGNLQQHRVAVLLNDITEAKEAELRVRESEGRLRIALHAAQMGTWIWYLQSNRHVLDESLVRLMGLVDGASGESHDDFIDAIHPEDRERVRAAFDRTVAEGTDLSVEFRVVTPDGKTHWLKDQGRIVADDRGAPLFMAGACVDITDRKEAELRLQRADQAKTEFLAMLAHELRNPMGAISNSVNILQRVPSHEAESAARTATAILRRQTDHLAHLVGDLLEVSRIEQGKIDLKLERVDLLGALSAAIETVTPILEARRQRLVTSLPTRPITLRADVGRLMQIVANLLHNASKFSAVGAQIVLSTHERGAEVEIVVRDEGVGIAPEMLSRIFDLFEQGTERSLARSEGGLGIGLALAKRLVEMHGGTIGAQSEGLGHGASFIVRLPRQ